MAKLKETEINENIIDSLNAGEGDNTVIKTDTGDKDLGLKDEIVVDKLEEKTPSNEVPDYADKILKMYSDKESLFIGPFGETHDASCNIKEVREQFPLYSNKHYNKKINGYK